MEASHMQRYVTGLVQQGFPCISFECGGSSLAHRSDVYGAVLAHTIVWQETRDIQGWILAGHSMVRRQLDVLVEVLIDQRGSGLG